jgi:hypothetical protein
MSAWGTENPMLATFTAMWFQATMNLPGLAPAAADLLFNSSNPDSICNYAEMAECFVRRE